MSSKPKVLIVDDQIVNRMTVKISLKEEGYEFFDAENGLEAVMKAEEIKPDIILMDAMMPKMDGFEATRTIRTIESIQRVPVLMLTSLDQKEDKIKALEAGVNDFISKPFDKLELKARCKSYVEINSLNQKYTLATLSTITDLPNKTALMKVVSLARKNKGLFLIKIDNFEMHENFYGVTLVEALERAFSQSLNQYADILGLYKVYHIGSGKYAILLKNIESFDREKIEYFAQTLCEDIKKTKYSYEEYHFDINVTVSYAEGTNNLYEDANSVLNVALTEKKDYLLSYDVLDNIKASLKENLSMLKTIKIALRDNKIFPYYQPIYNIAKNGINRYEALIRLEDENGFIIPPGPYFLEVAKKGKLYADVTKILFLKVLDKIRDSGCEISVNLSSLDIEDQVMSEYLLRLLKENADITDKLIFELLEDKETQDYEYVNHFIDEARKLGVKIAIDDFGSGYSNFIRIVEFKPDIIKIDGSLIADLAISDSHRKTVEAISLFAQKLGAKTVAEYVINEKTYDIIKEIGIDYAQGYYIGKPQASLMTETAEALLC